VIKPYDEHAIYKESYDTLTMNSCKAYDSRFSCFE